MFAGAMDGGKMVRTGAVDKGFVVTVRFDFEISPLLARFVVQISRKGKTPLILMQAQMI